MVIELSPERLSELIRSCVHVSDEKKVQLIADWEAGHMAHGLPLPGLTKNDVRSSGSSVLVVASTSTQATVRYRVLTFLRWLVYIRTTAAG
jgi:hypothetical protein